MTAPVSRPDVDVCPRCADSGRTIPVHAYARDGAEFDHRCPVCRHEWTVTRTPQELTPPASHTALDQARPALREANLDLYLWHRGPADEASKTYVTAGHDAVKRIDDALAALHAARAALIADLRRDEDLRGIRVDATLAARRIPDSGTASGDPAPEADNQAHINP